MSNGMKILTSDPFARDLGRYDWYSSILDQNEVISLVRVVQREDP
jgi:hypothetical protein